MAKRRTLQQLFDLAIDSGEYREGGYFMCNALKRLYQAGLITAEEKGRGQLSINKHLNKHDAVTMGTSLADKGILDRYEAAYRVPQVRHTLATEIYRNWSRRDALLYWQTRAMQLKLKYGFIKARSAEQND